MRNAVSAVGMCRIYKRYDTDVYLDYADGYIFVSTDGKKINVETSHERNTDIYDKYDK